MSKLVFWTTQASKKTKGAFLPVKSVETAEVYMSIPWLEQAREWTYILLQQQQQLRGGGEFEREEKEGDDYCCCDGFRKRSRALAA